METNPKNQPLSSYLNLEPYPLTEGKEGYTFTTVEGIRYNLRIALQEGYYNDKSFAEDAYELSILPEHGDQGGKYDPRIEATLVDALFSAFLDNPNLVLIYICSTKNEREVSRNKLFARWFQKNGGGFDRLEFNHQERRQFAIVFFKKEHPAAKEIASTFAEIDTSK